MVYSLDQGPTEARILKQWLRDGGKLPDAIENAPTLLVGLQFYLNAFFELSTCRGGMGGPIPWLAVDAYCTRNGLTDEEYEDLLYHVRALDDVVLKREQEKAGT